MYLLLLKKVGNMLHKTPVHCHLGGVIVPCAAMQKGFMNSQRSQDVWHPRGRDACVHVPPSGREVTIGRRPNPPRGSHPIGWPSDACGLEQGGTGVTIGRDDGAAAACTPGPRARRDSSPSSLGGTSPGLLEADRRGS